MVMTWAIACKTHNFRFLRIGVFEIEIEIVIEIDALLSVNKGLCLNTLADQTQ
jgi:hypothetical protein